MFWLGNRNRPTATRTVAPADVMPGRDQVMVVASEYVELDRDARVREALRVVRNRWLTQALREPAFRDREVMDLCEDLQSILGPADPDPSDLHEPIPYALTGEGGH